MIEDKKEVPSKADLGSAEETGGKQNKARPTNCAQSNKRIRRKDWYYRDGKYFANKQCHRLFVQQEAEKAKKEKEKEVAPATG